MQTYNEPLENHFNEIADLMSILGENAFKIRAYRDVARKMKEEIDPITKANASKAAFKKIPGVGDALADKMMQYVQQGKIDYLEKLRAQIPEAVRDMLKIPHLGPNRVRDLYINLGIKSKKDLKEKAINGNIANLPGFGEKLVQQILNALESGQQKKKRHEREMIQPIVEKVTAILKGVQGVDQVTVAGSYRRESDTVGDIDILVSGQPAAAKAEKAIKEQFEDLKILASGETKVAFVIFPENLQVDIRFVPEESYGSALLYFTGSKDFNVKMRKVAIEQGCLLNEYGLFKSGEYIAGKTEEEVFKRLNMHYTDPRERT